MKRAAAALDCTADVLTRCSLITCHVRKKTFKGVIQLTMTTRHVMSAVCSCLQCVSNHLNEMTFKYYPGLAWLGLAWCASEANCWNQWLPLTTAYRQPQCLCGMHPAGARRHGGRLAVFGWQAGCCVVNLKLRVA